MPRRCWRGHGYCTDALFDDECLKAYEEAKETAEKEARKIQKDEGLRKDDAKKSRGRSDRQKCELADDELFIIPGRMVKLDKKIDRARFIKCLCGKSSEDFHKYITHYYQKRIFKTV